MHGVLLLDKPVGLSSNDALQKAKRLFRAEKAGHTGTLDPLASRPAAAVLRRRDQVLAGEPGRRQALHRHAASSGAPRAPATPRARCCASAPVAVDRAAIDAAAPRFTGAIEQLPPMHSALKHDGKALYEYARAGIEVERAPRRVTIHRIDILAWQGDELAARRGVQQGHLHPHAGRGHRRGARLRRAPRRAAPHRQRRRSTCATRRHARRSSQRWTRPARDALLCPPTALLADWPPVRLADDEAGRFLTGLRRRIDAAPMRAARARLRPRTARLPRQRPHHRRRADRRPPPEPGRSRRPVSNSTP